MDLRNGRTFRRCLQHIPQDSLLEVKTNSPNRESILLCGYELYTDLQYSIKKKYRWEITQLMSKGSYEDDQPIVYSKHQCVTNCSPLLDLYLYDSILEKEVGNAYISNQNLEKGGFNSRSTIKQIEKRLDYTKKEKHLFEKSKQRGRQKSKQTRKCHRPERIVFPERHEELPVKTEYIEEMAKREKCVYVKEYIHVNKISSVNRIEPVHSKRRELSKDDIKFLKRKNKEFLRSVSLEVEEADDINDDVSVPSIEDTSKPFILTSEDFLRKKEPHSHKRRKRKKENICKPIKKREIVSHIVEPTLDDTVSVMDLHEDLLPCIVIETDERNLVDDIVMLKDFCRCRISTSDPPMILIDLDDSVDSTMKSFIILKGVNSSDNRITVKVIFNLWDRGFDYGEIFDQHFDSVTAIVALVQSRLNDVTSKRYTPSRKLITLSGKVNGMSSLWNTKKSDSQNALYLLHKEWISCEVKAETLYTMVRNVGLCLTECAVCFCDVLDEEMIVLGSCGHVTCTTCISSHIVWRLESGMRDMICPGSECSGFIDITVILSLISWRRYCKRLELLETAVISGAGCPCSVCGAVLMDNVVETSGKKIEYRCVCGSDVCSGCGRLRHFPSTCHEMITHQRKMVALRDLDMVPLRVKPLIFTGRPCPKCFNFVVKDGGCNHISCSCGTHFCWGCGDPMGGGRHLSASFPCSGVSDLVKQDLTRQSIVPLPSSIRPRLYCTALAHHIDNHNYESVKFHKRLSSILQWHCGTEDARQVVAQITELSTVIECIFVKAYQIDRRRQVATYRYIKSSASLFVLFQHRIKAIVDSYSGNTQDRPPSKRQISEQSTKLLAVVREANSHLSRFSHFFGR